MQYYSQGSLNGEGGADSFHLAQFFFVQELKTSALHSLVCGGKHQICTNGKKEKKKTSLTAPPSHLHFDQEQTAASLQSLTNAMAQYVEKITQRYKHVKTMNKSNTREYSAFLINYEHSVGFRHWRMC